MRTHVALTLALLLFASTGVNGAALNATCFAPTSQGGLGFCGPSACGATAVKTSKPSCDYTGSAIDYSASISKLSCRACTQSSSSICSATTLKSLVVGTGIKAAYCTDTHLVIISDGSPSWTPNLDDIPNPPGSTQTTTGTACVTRSTSVTPSLLKYKIPLNFTLLGTAASTNNMAAFPDGAADSYAGYMKNNGTGSAYGLPTRGSVGVSVSGQDIFPVFNNRAEVTDDSCEVDSCNEHVGGGGGQPHLHGDPFGPWCLYSATNYSSTTVHPPQIGWSIDGPSIFGRYLYTTSLGYNTTLDDCGGHQHDSMAYHYHTQVIDTVTSTPANGMASGISYTYSTVGVNKCWRADISKILGFWDAANNSTYFSPCCGMTQFYLAPGINSTFSSSSSPTPTPSSTPASSPMTGAGGAVPSCTTPSGTSPSNPPGAPPRPVANTTICPKAFAVSTTVTSIPKTSSSNTAGLDLYQVSATGCPNRDWSGQKAPSNATYQNYVWLFPVAPVIAATPTYVSRLKSYPNGTVNSGAILGAIGLTVDGIAIFNDCDAEKRDAYVYESISFDSCRAHVNSDGAYHYHSEPGAGCAYNDTTGKHSPLFAMMADGIPMYGAYGDNGKAPTDLDICGGHTDTTYNFYHYHVTANLTAPYAITCLMGCIFSNQGNGNLLSLVKTATTCTASATQYNYSSLTIPWIGLTTSTSTPASTSNPTAPTSTPTVSSSTPYPTTATNSGTCPKASAVSTTLTTISKSSSSNTAGLDLYQVAATGCPNRDWSGQTTPNTATYQNYVWLFPVAPVIAATPSYISRLKSYPNGTTNSGSIMGPIGLTVDGVVVFNDADADGRDAYVYESVSFDSCRAHVNSGGSYHYHTEPGAGCAYTDTAGKHSPLFALMADGIPLYGSYGDNGKVPTDLDVCGGHTDTTYKYYHYHTTNLTAPYTVTCLRGCVFNKQGNNPLSILVKTASTCTASATQYDYSSLMASIPWAGLTTSTPATTAGRRRAQATSTRIAYTCPATTLVTPHTTALGTALGTFDLTSCNANAAKATLASAAAYSTPSGNGTGGQLSIGSGSSLITGGNLTINGTVTCTLSDGTKTTCLALVSNAFPDHVAGPWCSGGNWNNTVVNYSAFATNCNCQRNSCNSSCSDMCLECPLLSAGNTYYIPVNPTLAASTTPSNGDNNFGDGISLAGVPLARADPLSMLSSINNPAPLDWYGGHATLQYVYHYHAIPTYHFNCSTGWDAFAHVWASAAPNGQHSQQIGWALDGFPVFGPYSVNGVMPTVGGTGSDDTDSCYGHTHTPYGYHYHSRDIHDGKTEAFLSCYKGKRAVQTFDSQSGTGAPSGGPGGSTTTGGATTGGTTMTNTTSGTAPNPCSNTTTGNTTGGAMGACAAGITKTGVSQQCCGDGVCDGPETNSTCAADCSGSSGTAPSSSAPSPNTTSAPNASAASSSTPSPTEAATVKQLQNTFNGMDYNTLAANATRLSQFSNDTQRAIANALGLSIAYVAIKGVTAGSVVVNSEATFPASQYSSDQANQLTTALVNSPSSAFSSAFTSTYGVTSISAADVTPTSSSSSGLSKGAIIGIAVGGGVGCLLAVAIIVMVVMKKKSASGPGSAPSPLPTGIKVLPVDHDV